MPWTRKQQKVAQAVEHGWKPKGKSKGFTKDFAEEVVSESDALNSKRKKAESMLGKGANFARKG
jgi:hypothetical protein